MTNKEYKKGKADKTKFVEYGICNQCNKNAMFLYFGNVEFYDCHSNLSRKDKVYDCQSCGKVVLLSEIKGIEKKVQTK